MQSTQAHGKGYMFGHLFWFHYVTPQKQTAHLIDLESTVKGETGWDPETAKC